MKVKLFTHTDLDGVGCAIVGRMAFPNKIDIEYCNYDDINAKVKDFIIKEDYKNYDLAYITDISVNEEIAGLITNTHPSTFKEGFNLGEMFCLLDHHPTALFLNKYFWAYVTIEKDDEKTSGTRMFYDHLVEEGYLEVDEDDNLLFQFVETVRKYDTWLWKEKYNDENPKMWNDLLYMLGREEFIEKIIDIVTDRYFLEFSDSDLNLLNNKQKEIDKYIEGKNKNIIQKEILGYKAGVVFAEQYHSELGNKLSELNPELDFIAIINMDYSISYRTTKDVNLSEIAKLFGGGGHPKASGSPISDEVKNQLLNMLFTV